MEVESAAQPESVTYKKGPRVRIAFRTGIAEFLLVICGLIFIRRDVYLQGNLGSVLQHWQEGWVCAAMLVDGIIRGAYSLNAEVSPLRKKVLKWGLPAGLFLYAACASLCIKLHIGTLDFELMRNAGVAILSVSLITSLIAGRQRPLFALQQDSKGTATASAPESITSDKSQQKPLEVKGIWRYVRYPDRFAILITLTGLSLALGTWVPLLALPGIFVAFKWDVHELEIDRVERFGESYTDYQKASKALIPFIY